MNWNEFFNMGGYGFFVWTSYGVTAVVLIANIVGARMRHKQEVARLKQQIALEQES